MRPAGALADLKIQVGLDMAPVNPPLDFFLFTTTENSVCVEVKMLGRKNFVREHRPLPYFGFKSGRALKWFC